MTTDIEETTMSADGIQVDLNSRVTLMVGVPAGLRIAVDQFSKEHATTTPEFVRKLIADAVGYTLPASGRVTKKYGSEDERKKAQAARNKTRRDLINALLKQVTESEDDEDDDD